MNIQKEKQKNWYNNNRATCSSELIEKNNEVHFNRLDGIINYQGDGLSLEVGCGEGWYLGKFGKTIGIDISFESLRKAKAKGAAVLVADLENLPFKEEVFSFAYGFAILHHIYNIEAGIREIKRCLQKSGEVAFGAENSANCLMNYIFPLLYGNGEVEKGFTRIVPANLALIFSTSGFKDFSYDISGYAIYGLSKFIYTVSAMIERFLLQFNFCKRFAGFVYLRAIRGNE